jgi:CCR4-NOT transcription complex subunit 3
MANARKVQTEIDKLLKKVQEGMEVYESVFEKVNSAPDRLQKEKFEAELKKEIKKLQRLREQIKALHASPEVKDKKQLEVTRRAIEVKMEGFKVCERETKTKAFSKEGLASNKSDPAARAKAKTAGWINSAIQELQDQIDALEFDLENEGVMPAKKSKKGTGDEREERIARNQHHILKLEAILRVLEMGELEPEDVDEIEPEVQAFVEGWQDPNYDEDIEVDIYEMFDLPEGMVMAIGSTAMRDDSDDEEGAAEKASAAAAAGVTPAAAAAGGAAPSTTAGAAVTPAGAAAAPTAPKKEKLKEATPPQKIAPKVPVAKKAPTEPAPKVKQLPSPATVAKAPVAQPAGAAASGQPALGPKTPITPLTGAKGPASPGAGKSMAAIVAGHREAELKAKEGSGAKLAKDFGQPNTAFGAAAAGKDELLEDEDDGLNDDTFGDDAMGDVQPGGGSLADLASLTTSKLGGDWARPLPAAVAGNAAAREILASAPKLPMSAPSKAAPTPAAAPKAAPVPPASPLQPSAQAALLQTVPAASSQAASAPPAAATSQPASAAVQRPAAATAAPFPSTDVIQRMLNISLRNLPHTSDCERPKPYTPPNPYQTPDYYPQTVHPAFNFPETFSKFDVDTLFFIFYYQQASYQQYLAAKELKKQSWRFHKKFQTWFQRHDRPKVTNEEHEQGTYIYFDYEGGWCQRIKADFIFRYSHLEDSLI